MSLSAETLRQARIELVAALEQSGLSRAEVAADLGFTEEGLAAAVAVDRGADPVEVWMVRDYLEQAARDRGAEPYPHTVLTEELRIAALKWFDLRQPPWLAAR